MFACEHETKKAVEILMARNKKLDVEIFTEAFDIDVENKTFTATKKHFKWLTKDNFPWENLNDHQCAEGEKGNHPRIRLVSSETGNQASFFLKERSSKFEYAFYVSFGTLINKKNGIPNLKGWKIILN